MKRALCAILLFGLIQVSALAGEPAGLTKVPSAHDVATTADRLTAALDAKGLTVFARIDHAAGAAKAGMELAPTELVIFGNPKLGTALMHCGHTAAIDLPLKALVWQDAEGKVWLAYNTPEFLAQRHDLAGCDEALAKMGVALAKFAEAATQ